MGVVGLPSAVTGFAAISIIAEMTFMPGRHSSSNRSHTAGDSGLAWRLISKLTVFVAMMPFGLYLIPSHVSESRRGAPKLFGGVVSARARLDVLRVHFFEFELRAVAMARETRLGGLQELLVVALGEVRFVVRAARFIAQDRALNNYP